MLTADDYQVLFPVALQVFGLTEMTGSTYTQLFLETNLGKYFLVEALLLEISEVEAKKEAVIAEKEFAKLAKQDEEEDTIFDGISRCFKVYEFIKKVIDIAKGQGGFVFWPVSYLVGRVINKMKEHSHLKSHLLTQRALERAQEELSKKYHVPPSQLDPDEVARVARSLAVREKQRILQRRIGQLEKQDLNFLRKLKLWALKLWKKIYPEKVVLSLAESIERLIQIARQNPLLSSLVIVLALAATIFTIFKWNKIKRFFGFLARIVTSPVRILIRGVKWLLNKLMFWRHKESRHELTTY